MQWSLLISNSSFVQKMVAENEVTNKWTKLIQILHYLGPESWLLMGQYC